MQAYSHNTAPVAPRQSLPRYNTPEYWALWAAGGISDAQAQADTDRWQAHRERPLMPPPCRIERWRLPAPSPSRQFARAMLTTAARDARLSSTTVRLLQLAVAEIGNDGARVVTRARFAKLLGKSARTVQRGLSELKRFGYLLAEVVCGRSGLQIGQRLALGAGVLPEKPVNPGETKPSPINRNFLSKKAADAETCPQPAIAWPIRLAWPG